MIKRQKWDDCLFLFSGHDLTFFVNGTEANEWYNAAKSEGKKLPIQCGARDLIQENNVQVYQIEANKKLKLKTFSCLPSEKQRFYTLYCYNISSQEATGCKTYSCEGMSTSNLPYSVNLTIDFGECPSGML